VGEPGYGTLAVLLLLIACSLWMGAAAQRAIERGSFVTGFFLGNRGLGAWALALTATVQSGGTFMGFPSYVYAAGWVVALWIAAYMVVPITAFAVIGKRFAQLSRRTGAITVPDLFRERFASPRLALLTSLSIMLFVSLTMIAQFKAGAILMKHAWPDVGGLQLSDRWQFLLGLAIFTATVVGYTLVGGFLASVWTDLFQSVLMAIGVVLLFVLIVPTASHGSLEQMTLDAIRDSPHARDQMAFGPGMIQRVERGEQGERVERVEPFLPIGAAASMFLVWIFGGIGAPSGMVRLMASKDTATLRRSIVLLSGYNLLIYLPLTVICIAAHRVMSPIGESDEIIPRLAIWSTQGFAGGSLVAGLILTAPFGAVMASVSSFLVLIASGLVRDVYQGVLRPRASEMEIRRVTRLAMIGVGAMAFVANLWPVAHLQSLIVFSSEAIAATLAVPAILAAHWRRATAQGMMAAMIAGVLITLAPYIWQQDLYPTVFGLRPVVFGLAASLTAAIVVSLSTSPPPRELVSRLFDSQSKT
jgi:SSS family solute:Na+ symporter/sodium/pantothenate symporter